MITDEDSPVAIAASDLLANDADPEGGSLSIASVTHTSSTHGSVELVDGKVIYAPDGDFDGPASLVYTIVNAAGATDPALVTIEVRPVNDTPAAHDDHKVAVGDQAVTFPAADLAANDSAGPPNESSQTLTVTGVRPESGSFTGPRRFATGDGPHAVVVADLNRDGHPDLATANPGPEDRTAPNGSVSILLGDGAGDFRARSDVVVGDGAVNLATGDFDEDGNPDLVTVNDRGSDVSVLLGDGSGGVDAARSVDGDGPYPASIGVGDFDGDGNADLVVGHCRGGGAVGEPVNTRLSFLAGDGGGRFTDARHFEVRNCPRSIEVGDVNRDGHTDVLAVAQYDDALSLLLGDGHGEFTLRAFVVGDEPVDVAISDLNGDGRPDLIGSNAGETNVSVLLADGAGGFSAATSFAVGEVPGFLAVGDLDGDSNADVAVTSAGFTPNDPVVLLRGDGRGRLTRSSRYVVGRRPSGVSVDDLNADGAPDIAVTSYDRDSVSVLLNAPAPAPIHGSVSLHDGTIEYTPDAGFVGEASFGYDVCDDGTTAGSPDPLCTQGRVEIEVTAPNRPPVAVDDAFETLVGRPLSMDAADLLANDSDPDGDTSRRHRGADDERQSWGGRAVRRAGPLHSRIPASSVMPRSSTPSPTVTASTSRRRRSSSCGRRKPRRPATASGRNPEPWPCGMATETPATPSATITGSCWAQPRSPTGSPARPSRSTAKTIGFGSPTTRR